MTARLPESLGVVPVGPIRPFLRQAVAAAREEDGHEGAKELARRIAARFGTNPRSEERQIGRILGPTAPRFIHVAVTDRLATFLGLHLENVWPHEDVAS